MSKFINNKFLPLVGIGTIFATEIKTALVDMSNYQSAKIVIATDDAVETTAETTARILAVNEEGTETEIKTQTILIGNGVVTEIDLVANELAHYDAVGFKVVVDAVAESTVEGGIGVVLDEARYTE